MAWETRSGSWKYFYLNQRLPDGRIRKRYFGSGLLADIESLRCEKRADLRRQLSEERQQTAAAESLLKQHLRSTNDVTHALMLSIGYTNERSRGWRRLNMIAPNEVNNENVPCTTDDNEPSFSELVKAARQGDRSAIPALRRMMQKNPELAKNNGDLASQTQIHWIDLIAGQDLYRRECLLMKVAVLKRELMSETNSTLVEQMLVDQAVSTWLQLYYHEGREATSPAENIKLGEYRLKKIESAFNRHMRSLNALASMRAINFTKRMAEAMTKVIPDTAPERRQAFSKPATHNNVNRIGDAFSRILEPVPMN